MRPTLRFVLAFTAAWAVGGAQPALADAGQLACGADVYEDVKLEQDLTCTGSGLVVKASGVTIDLNGHTIRYVGPTAPDEYPTGVRTDEEAIFAGGGMFEDVQVRNGAVVGFPVGVNLSYVSGATVQRLRTDGPVAFGRGNDAHLSDSTVGGVTLTEGVVGATKPDVIERNKINGTVTLAENGDVQIVGNHIRPEAERDGVFVIDSARVHVRNNRIQGGADGIMYLFSSGDVRGNTIMNSVVGVRLAQAWAGVLDNKVIGARQQGLHLSTDFGSPASLIRGNRVVGSGADGLLVEAAQPSSIKLGSNQATGNSGHGINALGVTDSGGNRARGNGTAPQCIGVVCK